MSNSWQTFNMPYFLGMSHISKEWAIEPSIGRAIMASLPGLMMSDVDKMQDLTRTAVENRIGYNIIDEVAHISMEGLMTKRPHCLMDLMGGGVSTILTRHAIRHASRSNEVAATILKIDSPGGDVSGAFDLASDIALFSQIKPIYAYIEDAATSAAYLIASQATNVFGNHNALSGSIGVFTVLEDMSEAAKTQGIKVHVVKAGEYKAIGERGTEITKAQLNHVQSRVDSIHNLFLSFVKKGRNLTSDQIDKIKDAGVYVGKEGVQLGLIDKITSLDELQSIVVKDIRRNKNGT